MITSYLCSSYDGYGFSQKWVGTEKEILTNPLEAKVRKLDNQARTAQSVIDVSPRSGKGSSILIAVYHYGVCVCAFYARMCVSVATYQLRLW